MVCPRWPPALAVGILLGATSTWAATSNAATSMSTVRGAALMLECESSQACGSISKTIMEKGRTIRHTFKSDVFIGLSVQLPETKSEEHDLEAILAQSKGIKDKWTVQKVNSSPAEKEEEQPEIGLQNIQEKPEKETKNRPGQNLNAQKQRKGRLTRRKNIDHWDHIMTQVDKLHKEGFTGKGIKIAVVDTGANYKVKALGGCFGKGCKVAFGANLSGEGDENDPIDCIGHGTQVASVLGGYDDEEGFVGAAPNATLMIYRVHTCKADALTEDTLVAGFLRAKEDGAQIIVSSSGFSGYSWGQSHAAAIVSRIVASGVPCIVGLGNSKRRGLFGATNPAVGRGVTAVNTISSSFYFPGLASSFGPTWELDIKPQVSAPGQSIRVATQNGDYAFTSGTSFAGPLVAGVFALVAEARGTFDPVLLNSLLISTAEPVKEPSNDYLSTVAQQGGGVVKAWEAAHATTYTEPSMLAFNDTEHRVRSISLRINNTAKTEVTYRLSNVAAGTLGFSFEPEILENGGDRINVTANVKMSQDSLTIGPGQSATVDVSAADPEGLDSSGQLAVWSGWIKMEGSDGKNLTVPYLGLGGSLKSAPILQDAAYGPGDTGLDNSDAKVHVIFPDPPNGQKPGPSGGIKEPQNAHRLKSIRPFASRIYVGTPELRVIIVPFDICPSAPAVQGTTTSNRPKPNPSEAACVPKSMLTESFGLRSIGQLPGFPKKWTSFGDSLNIKWDGSFGAGEYVPPGRYKLIAQALTIFGNATSEDDWQHIETIVTNVMYEHNIMTKKGDNNTKPPNAGEKVERPQNEAAQ
ncbi:hypothetical protein QQS21_005482 [Conoideocrella luteorostrata]|uniref:Uncharacterized protein n=1 Tax=Conoideocrella luteorostrata TaxID=1105319 RepID=A0AAJ0FZ01_9HYPO|nr:hypothetical protein QQS21_005482 [Conoideocrella luteorostrata]